MAPPKCQIFNYFSSSSLGSMDPWRSSFSLLAPQGTIFSYRGLGLVRKKGNKWRILPSSGVPARVKALSASHLHNPLYSWLTLLCIAGQTLDSTLLCIASRATAYSTLPQNHSFTLQTAHCTHSTLQHLASMPACRVICTPAIHTCKSLAVELCASNQCRVDL